MEFTSQFKNLRDALNSLLFLQRTTLCLSEDTFHFMVSTDANGYLNLGLEEGHCLSSSTMWCSKNTNKKLYRLLQYLALGVEAKESDFSDFQLMPRTKGRYTPKGAKRIIEHTKIPLTPERTVWEAHSDASDGNHAGCHIRITRNGNSMGITLIGDQLDVRHVFRCFDGAHNIFNYYVLRAFIMLYGK